jgi:hypothetical protein
MRIKGGLAVDEFLERNTGGVYHKAILLAELGSSVEACRAEWEYDKSPETDELVRLCSRLEHHLEGLSIRPDGELTSWRECDRCGGAGGFGDGETICTECGGSGAVHRNGHVSEH